MQISRAYNPTFRFVDEHGKPIAGGTLCTYVAGSTFKPVATYADYTGTAKNPTRITLDSAGGCNMWLDDSASYRFVVYDKHGKKELDFDHVTTNTRTFKAECNDGTMDVVEREEDGVTTYTFGLKDNSIGWAKLKEPRHLIADTDWVEFEAQPNSDYVVVSLAPALRTWLEEQGYNG